MKKIFEVKSAGYKVFAYKILGYSVRIHETRSNGFSLSVPLGNTAKDIKMFDQLVYFDHSVYHASTRAKVINQVRNWINTYKKKND